MVYDLIALSGRFQVQETIKAVFPFGSGHINDTFKAVADGQSYLLQRINHHIFKDVYGLTNNLVGICRFLSQKVSNGEGYGLQVLNPILTKNGDYLLPDDNGNYWRMFDFVEGSRSYDRAENKEMAHEGGRTFGLFIKLLHDFPVETLTETIHGFHNYEFRFNQFEDALKSDVAGRVQEVTKEIVFIESRAKEMKRIHDLVEAGKIPLRVTHNDTKISNILFDQNNKGICVIDLDTVMPGCIHSDFGDAIRTFTNTTSEDEKDLSKVSMSLELFEAYAKGFLSETRDILSGEEVSQLAFSARYITWEQTLRFLTDYINGDVYYKTGYPGHNLIRARAQARLLESMEEQFEEMERIIQEV
jgi:aminoglycoside phosphotransferase (APT) family kinase protein